MRSAARMALVTAALLTGGGLVTTAQAQSDASRAKPIESAGPVRAVPVPAVELVPADVGSRGGPLGTVVTDPADFGYVEEEFFLTGTAKSYGAAAEDAAYKTRIYVLRPADPARFNGTVVVEWANVSAQRELFPVMAEVHEYLVREGYGYVSVSAQRAGIDGGPECAPDTVPVCALPAKELKSHDPQRYGSLVHPGDDYSFDIFSQAGQAILAGSPRVFQDSAVEALLGVGQSQSCRHLVSYLQNGAHRDALRTAGKAKKRSAGGERVFDGVLPMDCPSGAPVPTDLGPVMWADEVRADERQPDEGDFRLVEIAGAPHGAYWQSQYHLAVNRRNDNRALPSGWDREESGQYGERGGGPCMNGFFPDRWAHHAVLDHLNGWVRTGTPAPSWPRLERAGGVLLSDEHGNVRGGFRLPVVDVPIAKYESCAPPGQRPLYGQTTSLDPQLMQQLYPSPHAYLEALRDASDAAVAVGSLLPEDAAELMERAAASLVGTAPLLVSPAVPPAAPVI